MTSGSRSTSEVSASEQAQAIFQEGWRLHQAGQIAKAGEIYRTVIGLAPGHFNALQLLGTIAAQSEDFIRAVEWFDRAIAANPGGAVAHYNRGAALARLGRHADALANFDRAIEIRPDYTDAYNNRGNVQRALGRHTEALASYDAALRARPDAVEALVNRANTLRDLGRLDAAVAAYDSAISLKADVATVHNDRGIALWLLKSPGAALDSYDAAIGIKPDFAEAHINRGVALRELRRPQAALDSFDKALELKPDHAGAHSNRGTVLNDLGDNAAALADFEAAVRLQPLNADAHNNRGATLCNLGRYVAALASFDTAIGLNPRHADAHCGRGHALKELGQFEAAIASYDLALGCWPDYPYVAGSRLHAKMLICDWRNLDQEVASLIKGVERGDPVTPSFPLLALTGSPSVQRKAAELWTRDKCPPDDSLGSNRPRPRRDRIRIGYFSMDFRNHPVSILTAELFETHDRAKFEITGFAFGPPAADDMRKRLESAFDRFLDVGDKSDREIAVLARSLEIDIAVDLAGYTSGARPAIFAHRAAPVQISYLGYPGTMGAPYIDYVIADRIVIPAQAQRHFSEKVIYLPCFQANDSQRRIAPAAPRRADIGLPASGVVYCCFNNTYKIEPAAFGGWMDILKQVEGSVLWLSANNASAVKNLRTEASRRGVNPARLIFAARVSSSEDHLARLSLADLFLDTVPYNAHVTASDALWAGLPVLTCPGEAYASRVAASLLTTLGLPELIAATPGEYVALAVELARKPERLADIKRKLARCRATSSLFDTKVFARHIEAAFAKAYDRGCAGLAPDHIAAAES